MRIVIFGLTVSSSWGNGHATLWRSLIRALLQRGHTVSFFERDVAYYADARDLERLPEGGELIFYGDFGDVRELGRKRLDEADLAICTSYCPDGREACALVLASAACVRCFYDLDTPVTLDALDRGGMPEYLPREGLGAFDLVLSYTGGRALAELQSRLGARLVAPLYGSVDPETHFPTAAVAEFRSTMSYLGTYAADRQEGVERLLLEAARRSPDFRFLIGGAQYPQSFPWGENIFFVSHMPPQMHPAFFSSSQVTLNVTRAAMARYGFCPSGRLFEAAACGTPIITDMWEGLESFFVPGTEILPVNDADDVVNVLAFTPERLRAIGDAGRRRVLRDHTGEARVMELEKLCLPLLEVRSSITAR